MLKQILLFLAVFMILGCQKMSSGLAPLKTDESYLQATRKTELIVQGNTQIVVIATHLNEFDWIKFPREEGEIFFLDVYQTRKNGKGFLKNGYEIRLANGAKPSKITRLKKEDLEGMIAQNATQWGEYYWVEFPKQDKRTQDRMILVLSHKDFGENTLEFGFKKIKKY